MAALCAAGVAIRGAVAAEQSGDLGVSDPTFAAPEFAPGAALTGVAHAQMHVAAVRQNHASSVNGGECATDTVRGTSKDFIIGRNMPVRFWPESAFILVNAHLPRISA
jgi:hypothetical protein